MHSLLQALPAVQNILSANVLCLFFFCSVSGRNKRDRHVCDSNVYRKIGLDPERSSAKRSDYFREVFFSLIVPAGVDSRVVKSACSQPRRRFLAFFLWQFVEYV